jgi:hypothetical protein
MHLMFKQVGKQGGDRESRVHAYARRPHALLQAQMHRPAPQEQAIMRLKRSAPGRNRDAGTLAQLAGRGPG